MRPLRIFCLAALTAAVVLLCASSASATVLCKTNTTPCGSQVSAGTKVEMSLSGVSVMKAGITDECSGSEWTWKVENAGGSASTVSGKVENLKFSGCSCETKVLKAGEVETHWVSGTMNGTLTSKSAEVTSNCAGVDCVYGTGSGTDAGTLTGGEPAKLDVSATLPKLSGSFFCPGTASWTATYEVKTPKPLYVAESSGSATATTLTTSLSGEGKSGEEITVLEGSKVKDQATLSGTNASKATGTVEYKVYSDASCKELVTSAGTVTVTAGSVPASSEVELTAGAVYYWRASYSGDSNNLASTSTCGKEVATVKANTSIATTLSGGGQEGAEIEVEEEDAVTDSATLSGTNASKATGKVKYKVYSDEECKELVTSAGEVTVSGAGVPASSEVKLPDGFYYWQATYEGDSTHSTSASACGDEIEVVAEEVTLALTLLGDEKEGEEIEAEEGYPVAAEAALSGANAAEATGYVTYFVYYDSECKELALEAGTAPVEEEGQASPSDQVELPAGTYYWRAEYLGDTNNGTAISACGAGVTVVVPPPLTTLLSGEGESGTEITVEEGASVTDAATINEPNASTATGKVEYNVYSDGECKELATSAGEVTVATGGIVPASSPVTLPAGVYFWQAGYSGDLSHPAATSSCGDEILIVAAATSLTTSLSGEGESGAEIEVRAVAKVSDTATLSGANAAEATGSVVYGIYEDSKCETFLRTGGTVEVTEGIVPESEEVELPAGTYYWQAEYSGDLNNQPSASSCGSAVAYVGPALLTNELAGGGEEGAELYVGESAPVTDTATINEENASTATGTVKYRVYGDPECEELVTSAGEVSVSKGVVPASSKVELTEGTFYWQATYSGDETHPAATSPCGEAQQIVNAPWIVSVGDSYISGEGGRWAGNVDLDVIPKMLKIDALGDGAYRSPFNDEDAGEAIPLCHRSHSAEIFIAWPSVRGKNFACSGAETRSISVGKPLGIGATWKPGLDTVEAVNGGWIDPKNHSKGICRMAAGCMSQVNQLYHWATKRKEANEQIRMAVVSISGNDFGFDVIVKKCAVLFTVKQECRNAKAVKSKFEPAVVATIQVKIRESIENVGTALVDAGYNKADFTIMVQNYPSPLPANGAEIRYNPFGRSFPGRCPLYDNDANWANETALKTINQTVENAAKEAAAKYKVKRLRLESAFNGRRLCEAGLELVSELGGKIRKFTDRGAVDRTEWINQVRVLKIAAPFEIQEDFHPNYWGQLALRSCVREAYNFGVPKEGKCVIEAPGLIYPGPDPPMWFHPEPRMKLEP